MEGQQKGTFTSDRKSQAAIETRAINYALATDGVLLGVNLPGVLEGAPLIPDVKCGDGFPEHPRVGGFRTKTWRDFLRAQAHTSLPGAHRRGGEMVLEVHTVGGVATQRGR